jgi:pimeloyl-ACP methyl ester carboxylesterase
MDRVPEDRCEVETPFGPVWLWGRPQGRPTLLILTGLFADPGTMDHFGRLLPDLDVLRAHLPGNHCPRLTGPPSIETYARALDAALGDQGARPLAVLGTSTGALVALALRSPISAMLLLEPPLRNTEILPLVQPDIVARDPELMLAIFGATEAGIVSQRDYTPLLRASTCPIDVLLGGVRAHPGQTMLPSLVDDESRRQLAAAGNVRCIDVPGAGHRVASADPRLFNDVVQRLVDRLRATAAA